MTYNMARRIASFLYEVGYLAIPVPDLAIGGWQVHVHVPAPDERYSDHFFVTQGIYTAYCHLNRGRLPTDLADEGVPA